MITNKYIGYVSYVLGFLITLLNKKQTRAIKNYIFSAIGYLLIIIAMRLTPNIQNNIGNTNTLLNIVETAKVILKKTKPPQ